MKCSPTCSSKLYQRNFMPSGLPRGGMHMQSSRYLFFSVRTDKSDDSSDDLDRFTHASEPMIIHARARTQFTHTSPQSLEPTVPVIRRIFPSRSHSRTQSYLNLKIPIDRFLGNLFYYETGGRWHPDQVPEVWDCCRACEGG